MAISLSASKAVMKFGDANPQYTVTGAVNIAKLWFSTGLYIPYSTPYTYDAPNETRAALASNAIAIEARDVTRPAWTLDTGVTLDGDNDPRNTSSDGFKGAESQTTFAEGVTGSIEARNADTSKTIAVTLQSGTVDPNFAGVNCEYALILGEFGIGSVREKGALKNVRVNGKFQTQFTYAASDKALIVMEGGLIKYYHVKASDNTWTLLRQTRVTGVTGVTYPLKPAVTTFHLNNSAEDAYVWTGTKASVALDVHAVLSGGVFLDWGNQSGLRPTHELSTHEGGTIEGVTLLPKDYLRFYQLDLRNRFTTDAATLRAFWSHHRNLYPFYFVDNANSIETYVRFTDGLGDTNDRYLFNQTESLIEYPFEPVL